MAFKFIAFFAAVVAVASAGVVPAKFEEYDPHPQYSYGYDVKDAISGDSKTAVETRDGGFVQGQYSLNDADGYRRIVDYTSDPINGFNAVVRREPLVAAAPVVKAAVAAPFTYAAAAPVVKATYAAAPFTYAAPAAYAAAPVVKTVAPAPFTYAAAAPVVKAAYAAAPFTYAAPATYAAAPVVKAAVPAPVVAGPAVVKTSFASPLISYAY
ncbi:cuticle protein-like [Musca autumnalis]|uniref:cuticle protein-like n=1 Tax=Musca autumnalis TaxID=221902 RepID=UPI003CF2FA8A